MPAQGISKWAVGQKMIEWCERNGLDASRIVDREGALEISYPDSSRMCSPYAAGVSQLRPVVTAWQRYTPEEQRPEGAFRAGGYLGEAVEVEVSVVAQDEPPLNPEWLRLFPDYDGPGALP